MPHINPPRLLLAQLPTPMQLLERVSDELGGPRIWVKRDDLTGSVLTGNKVRKLEYLIADAKRQAADVLITCGGEQSNHCRATALAAAQTGLKAHLILRGQAREIPDGNLLLDHLAGASIAFYPSAVYQSQLPDLFCQWQETFQQRGLKSYAIPTGGSNLVGLRGYLSAAYEMDDQFGELGIDPKYVVCASGSGGTQAGLTLGFARRRPTLRVIGFAVCDSAVYFDEKVRADIDAWAIQYQQEMGQVAVQTCDAYIGPGYGVAEASVFETIAWLARTEGLVLDPVYTGKAFHGLISEIKAGRFCDAQDLVFIHTGGVFGVFPYRHQFL